MDKKAFLQDLAEGLARRKQISKKEAEAFARHVFEIVVEYLLSEQLVKVKGIGTFKLVTVDSRESINVNTGERFTIGSHSKITFTPDKTLSDQINRPFADFETVLLNEDTKTEDMERVDTPIVEEPLVTDESIVVEETAVGKEPVEEKTVEAESMAETPVIGITPSAVEVEVPQVEQEAPEPIVEEPKQEDVAPVVSPNDSTSKQGARWWIWALPCLVLLALVGYFVTQKSPQVVEPAIDTQKEVVAGGQKAPVAKTEVQSVENDVLTSVETVTEKPNSGVPSEEVIAANPQIEGGEYWMVGTKATVILERGDDLTKLALEHYGDKRLINYIIKYNHFTAKQASSLFVGAEVKLPELVKKP